MPQEQCHACVSQLKYLERFWCNFKPKPSSSEFIIHVTYLNMHWKCHNQPNSKQTLSTTAKCYAECMRPFSLIIIMISTPRRRYVYFISMYRSLPIQNAKTKHTLTKREMIKLECLEIYTQKNNFVHNNSTVFSTHSKFYAHIFHLRFWWFFVISVNKT